MTGDTLSDCLPGGQPPSETPPAGGTEGENKAAGIDERAAEAMFGDSTFDSYAKEMESDLAELGAAYGLNDEQSAEVTEQAVAEFRALGVNANEAAGFMSLYRETMLNPPTEEVQRGWAQEAQHESVYAYGEEELASRLSAVRNYLSRHPTLRDELIVSGLGDHPRVVREFLRNAYSLAGRR